MGILDMADEFCKQINTENTTNCLTCKESIENKVHEQPIVSFVEKENEQDVIYREEL